MPCVATLFLTSCRYVSRTGIYFVRLASSQRDWKYISYKYTIVSQYRKETCHHISELPFRTPTRLINTKATMLSIKTLIVFTDFRRLPETEHNPAIKEATSRNTSDVSKFKRIARGEPKTALGNLSFKHAAGHWIFHCAHPIISYLWLVCCFAEQTSELLRSFRLILLRLAEHTQPTEGHSISSTT